MIIDAHSGLRGVLVNADTNTRIPFARHANLETGEYEHFAATPDGLRMELPPRLIKGRAGKLRFVESYAPTIQAPAGVDAKAASEEREEYRRKTEPRLLIPGEYCEVRGCNKLAAWSVGIERLLTPVRQADGKLHEHAVLVRCCDYCSNHYRLPVQINQRGVESPVEFANRPQ